MDNFSVQDYAKLLKFYKDKASDIELQYLTLQINHSKELEKKLSELSESADKKFKEELSVAHTRIKSLEHTLLKISKESTKSKKSKNKK